MKKNAIIRLVVLSVLLVNQSLITMGYNPLPYSEEQIFEAVSALSLAIVSIYAWWKNNNVTREAQQAQKQMNRTKGK